MVKDGFRMISDGLWMGIDGLLVLTVCFAFAVQVSKQCLKAYLFCHPSKSPDLKSKAAKSVSQRATMVKNIALEDPGVG